MSVIPTEGVDIFWPEVEPMLAPAVALSGGRLDMPALLEGLHTAKYVLWVVYDDAQVIRAAFTSRVAVYPRRSVLAVECAGGTGMRHWVGLVQETFRNVSRDLGLSGVEMYGRPGWLRVLSRYGWKHSMMVMEVDQRETPQETGHE
jgi:hypothetical protein